MLTADEMPEDNAHLAEISVEFPLLEPNTASSCPVDEREVLSYLADEAEGGERLTPTDLRFIRTAQVGECRYWIWSFIEPGSGADAFVTVSEDAGGRTVVGFDENYYDLTPEQFMLGDFHDVF